MSIIFYPRSGPFTLTIYKGRRTIALPPSAALVLKEHKEKQGDLHLALGTLPQESDLVFSQPDGAALLPDTISHVWSKLAKRVGLQGSRLHDARHTHASLMLKQGIHPKVVQERLGHASIQTTLDLYSHVAPSLQEDAAKAFDNAFSEGLGSKRVAKVKINQPEKV